MDDALLGYHKRATDQGISVESACRLALVNVGIDGNSKLARVCAISPAAMSGWVDRMVALGLVERETDPEDRRSQVIGLTFEGARILTIILG